MGRLLLFWKYMTNKHVSGKGYEIMNRNIVRDLNFIDHKLMWETIDGKFERRVRRSTDG